MSYADNAIKRFRLNLAKNFILNYPEMHSIKISNHTPTDITILINDTYEVKAAMVSETKIMIYWKTEDLSKEDITLNSLLASYADLEPPIGVITLQILQYKDLKDLGVIGELLSYFYAAKLRKQENSND